jgi:hypothetical protein
MSKRMAGELYLSSGTSQSKGVAILISPNIETNINTVKIYTDGRYILMKGTFNGHKQT